jgi:hypothetical protein
MLWEFPIMKGVELQSGRVGEAKNGRDEEEAEEEEVAAASLS